MCPEVLEKPKGAPKGVSLNIKLDVIKHIWHDFGRSFLGSGKSPNCFHIN